MGVFLRLLAPGGSMGDRGLRPEDILCGVDGNPCTAKGIVSTHNDAFREDIQKGDTITIEVYQTSAGQYKISPDNNPLDFLIACCLIPLGAAFSLALVYDLQRIQAAKKAQRGAVKEKQR